jgi:hypothetical protein
MSSYTELGLNELTSQQEKKSPISKENAMDHVIARLPAPIRGAFSAPDVQKNTSFIQGDFQS